MSNITRKKLSKRNEPLYALTFFGPIFLNLFISVYLLNAFNDSGMINFFGLDDKTTDKAIVVTAIFSVLTLVSRIIDCLLNIPMAALSDKCRSRFGSRKPGILIGGIGIAVMYVLMCIPLTHNHASMLNTFYVFVLLLGYFASYAFCSTSFFATFAEVCPDTASRIRVTH
ncbi:hypothetical protein FACS1894166_10430 [Bacilli bacterium]|nr:hypothetical protein FACS1894166_10430 [Bacilli bacterium]